MGNNIAFEGHIIDNSAIPPAVPPAHLNNSNDPAFAALLNKVCTNIKNPVSNGITRFSLITCGRQGQITVLFIRTAFCRFVPITYGFHFNVDGDYSCDNNDVTSGHPQGLSALASIAGHEISETRSNPRGKGWYSNISGDENGDECAYTYGPQLLTFVNGVRWKIQGNLSNKALLAGIGYSDNNRDPGCIDGSGSYYPFSPTFPVSTCTAYTSESSVVNFGVGNGYATWEIGCNSGKPISGGCIINAVGGMAYNIFMYKSYTDPGANLPCMHVVQDGICSIS